LSDDTFSSNDVEQFISLLCISPIFFFLFLSS